MSDKESTEYLDAIENFEDDYVNDEESLNGSLRNASTTSLKSYLPLRVADIQKRKNLVRKTRKPTHLFDDEFNRCLPNGILNLFLGTWNMCQCKIPTNIDDFLLPSEEEYLQEIYVVGVQESGREQRKWEIKLQETLGTNHVLAHSASHGALHMAIFVRRDLIWFCTDFEDSNATTRIMSHYKTKGAVAVSFQCFGTSFLFISSHLRSGEMQLKERIENYHKIIEKLKLPSNYKGSSMDISNRFDYVFWFGDLNFRVQQPLPEIKPELSDPTSYNISEAIQNDELSENMRKGEVFIGFQEGLIQFFPTYKFVVGTDEYDTKLRVPSYTDRILYRLKPTCSVKVHHYNMVVTLRQSDHKPVYGFFDVAVKPGGESFGLGSGKFNREVYLEAARKRANVRKNRNSRICALL